MYTRRHRSCLLLTLVLIGSLSSGCLGEDYKNLDLTISDSDHGWMAVIEPDEQFAVNLWNNPVFPDASWAPVEGASEVVELIANFEDPYPQGNPAEVPPEEREGIPEEQVGLWMFEYRGVALGETILRFEQTSAGRVVDIAEFTIAVVEEACDGDRGLAAPRCRRDPQQLSEGPEQEYEGVHRGEDVRVALPGNALHPDAPWTAVSYDGSIVELADSQRLSPRTPRNWDTTDGTEPLSFLPEWEFTFTTLAAGASLLRFELVVDGETYEAFEITVGVEE